MAASESSSALSSSSSLIHEKEYTLDDVKTHTSTDSCWLIIGNSTNGGPKVYDVTKYLDDHPGGAEVMLDVAGQDADEFFEDIGHSKEARSEMIKYLIGSYKMDAAALKAKQETMDAKRKAEQVNIPLIMVGLIAVSAIVVGIVKMMG